jgi:hypothetical protein
MNKLMDVVNLAKDRAENPGKYRKLEEEKKQQKQ